MQVTIIKQMYFEFRIKYLSLIGMCRQRNFMETIFGHLRTTYILVLFGTPALSLADTEIDGSTDEVRSEISVDDIALELSNPVTALRSLSWDIEYTTFRGDLPGSEDQTGLKNIFTLSWPFKLSNGKNILLAPQFRSTLINPSGSSPGGGTIISTSTLDPSIKSNPSSTN